MRRRIENKAKLSAFKVRKLTLRKNFSFTIQNLQFKGKVLNNLSWKFRDILYFRRFLLPPTILGDSLSELGLCFPPPSVSCSSTTREYNKFLCHWLWLIMANWHLMPWLHRINKTLTHCTILQFLCDTADWSGETERKVDSAQSNVLEHWVTFLILRSSSWQTLAKGFCSFHVWRGKYRRESQPTGSNSGLQEFSTSICLRRRKTRKKVSS